MQNNGEYMFAVAVDIAMKIQFAVKTMFPQLYLFLQQVHIYKV